MEEYRVRDSLRASSPGCSGSGREKEGELATTSLKFKFHLQFPCGSPPPELPEELAHREEIVLHTGALWYIWNSLDRATRDLRSKFDGQWTTLTEAPVPVAKSKLAAVAIFRS